MLFYVQLLHPSKWPQLVVYMDGGLPLTTTNKVRRVTMIERMGQSYVSHPFFLGKFSVHFCQLNANPQMADFYS